MKMKLRHALLGAALLFAGVSAALTPANAGGLWPTLPAPIVPMSGNEVLPCDTELAGGANPQTEGCTVNNLSAYTNGLPALRNVLVGGDASTNLFQRATSGSSVTTTVTFGGPDRWAYWSGTSTAMTVSRDTTASDLPTSYQAAFKMARTSGQTGVVQVCMAQEVESVNSYQFAGTTAEFDFHAYTGANYSAASSNMTAYIVTGTGSDEGMAKLAFGLNAGGGGSTGWTGQANATAAVISLGAVSTAGRYAAIANIPAATTEIGVALCFTPVGTAGTNDYIAFSGIQLVRNNANAAYASTTVGYNSNVVQLAAFERRAQQQETALQQRYYYQLTESAAVATIAPCWASSVTVAQCLIQFPVTMRAAPIFSGDGGFTAGFAVPTTTAGGTLGNCSALALSTNIASTVAGTLSALIACTATTVPAAGSAGMLYGNGGSGKIKASAEMV